MGHGGGMFGLLFFIGGGGGGALGLIFAGFTVDLVPFSTCGAFGVISSMGNWKNKHL